MTSDASGTEIRRRLDLIEELTGIGYWEVDLVERTLLWSRMTYRLFGADPDTFVPTLEGFDRLVHPDDLDQVHAAIHRSRRTGVPYQIEHRIVRPDSSVRHVLEHGRHEFDADGRACCFRGTVQDITDVNEIRTRLVRAEREATLSRVMGEVAHDFNNLLSVVSGNLDILHIRYGDTPDAARLLERAQNSVVSGAALAERLLAFFNRDLQAPARVELVSAVREMIPTLSRVVGEGVGIELSTKLEKLHCRLDKTRLETAILNAALNARDAMPEGGAIKVFLSRTVLPDGRTSIAQLDIVDTGTGIDPDIIDRAFDPFFSTKTDRGGTGLGLSIIRDFAEASGGAAQIRSEPGTGTVLSLFLPVVGLDSADPEQHRAASAVDGSGRAILLLEDNENVRAFIADGLKDLGYRVTPFASPADALEYLERTSDEVSAILSDVRLSDPMDGFQFAEAAQRIRPGLPSLFVSGFMDPKLSGPETGDDRVRIIRKPFRIADLASVLNEIAVPPVDPE